METTEHEGLFFYQEGLQTSRSKYLFRGDIGQGPTEQLTVLWATVLWVTSSNLVAEIHPREGFSFAVNPRSCLVVGAAGRTLTPKTTTVGFWRQNWA